MLEYTLIGAVVSLGILAAGVRLMPKIRQELVDFRNCGIDRLMGKQNPC